MWLAALLGINVVLLTTLGLGVKKDEKKSDKDMQGWVAQPIPVHVSNVQVWRSAASKRFYNALDSIAYGSANGKYQPKHGYVHP